MRKIVLILAVFLGLIALSCASDASSDLGFLGKWTIESISPIEESSSDKLSLIEIAAVASSDGSLEQKYIAFNENYSVEILNGNEEVLLESKWSNANTETPNEIIFSLDQTGARFKLQQKNTALLEVNGARYVLKK